MTPVLTGCERVNSTEFKKRSKCSQSFYLNISEVKKLSVRSQRFHFNGSNEVKQPSEDS